MQLNNGLDDLLLPYKIDLSLLADISNPQLVGHINRVGKVFFDKRRNTSVIPPTA